MNSWFVSDFSIPFKFSFKHTAKTRFQTESLFVKVQDGAVIGFGESCPRFYVTGERKFSSKDNIVQFLKNRRPPFSIEEVLSWREEFYQKFPKQYAAWCAVELAGLDFLSKRGKKSIFNFLNCSSLQIPKYSAVIGIDSYRSFLWKILRYKSFAMGQIKMKASGDIPFDRLRLKTLKFFGFKKEHIRIDANNCFSDKKTAVDYIRQLGDCFWAVEEPLASKNMEELMDIASLTNKSIILDETINPYTIMEDLKILDRAKLILNLRISRLGGLLSSLQVARECMKRKVPYLIGSHVGESSLLNRGALALCGRNAGQPVAIEGGFSERLLKFDPALPKVIFGYRGYVRNIREIESSVGISTLSLKQWTPI